jgi:hypothetical protein
MLACNTSDVAVDYTAIQVDPGKAGHSLNLSSIFETIDYVPLDTPDDHLIGEVSSILFHGDRMYILDNNISNSLFCFQRDGTFLYEINRQGSGTGEYIELTAATIDHEKQHVLLYCNVSDRVLVFDLEGNYLRSVALGFNADHFVFVGEVTVAFFCDFTSNPSLLRDGTLPNLILTTSTDYAIQDAGLRFPASRNYQAFTASLAGNFASYRGIASLLVPYNDTLYHVTPTRPERAYLFDFGDKRKSANFYSMQEDRETAWEDVNNYFLNNDACNVL